jgi:hypothetical protein
MRPEVTELKSCTQQFLGHIFVHFTVGSLHVACSLSCILTKYIIQDFFLSLMYIVQCVHVHTVHVPWYIVHSIISRVSHW